MPPYSPCYLCHHTHPERIHSGTRDRADIDVLRCPACTLVYLSKTEHATLDLYTQNGQAHSTKSIPINKNEQDTLRRIRQYAPLIANKTLLDFGCGKGAFVERIMADQITTNIYTIEPNVSYKNHLLQVSTYARSITDIPDHEIDVITLFHVLEHIADPIAQLSAFAPKLKPNGRIIIEVPHAEDALLNLYKSASFAKFTYWSLHLYLFNQKTLRLLAKQTPFKVESIRYSQRYGLSNHLHWLATHQPGGQNNWDFLNDPMLDEMYEAKLAELERTDTITMTLVKEI
tara:strand:- start:4209 stop:5069 length:861 start_codon:yes stop_codon:yes gene_type:complete